MTFEPSDLVFRARALAQAHPLSPAASRFINRVVGQQRVDQPLPEIGIWAGGSLIDGYCLRRVEEEDGGAPMEGPDPVRESDADRSAELDRLEGAASAIAADIRSGAVESGQPGSEERTIAALDLLIAGAVERRLDHWRDSVDEKAWAELEEYLTWWVVKGYALRVAERHMVNVPISSDGDET
ncbi:MAG TPA: hypothetical protein VG184_02655 [Acidimicrobiales bacterium]|jgi:hypothetical protein|nr:hypothetical protein [Acidimicrobiales bacterium]